MGISRSSIVRPRGHVQFQVIRSIPLRQLSIGEIIEGILPGPNMPWVVRWWKLRNLPKMLPGFIKLMSARLLKLSHFEGILFLEHIQANGQILNYGLSSLRVITTAGVTEVATRFAGTSAASIANFKYHGLGTGTNAEAAGDTALQTELTTQYNPDSTRATGSQSASTNTYVTVGTNTVDAAAAVTEHGILTQAATGGGTLLDRSVFSVINLANGDSLQSTYTLTLTAGG